MPAQHICSSFNLAQIEQERLNGRRIPRHQGRRPAGGGPRPPHGEHPRAASLGLMPTSWVDDKLGRRRVGGERRRRLGL